MSQPTISQVESEERECPLCGVLAEPEVDAELRYWVCENEDCEVPLYEWGYEKIEEGVRVEGNCSVGIPESVRRASSAPMEKALLDQKPVGVVDLGLTIGRRPE